ncbi:MAG: peptidyl-prolyl cis-trans isomerase [Deltaproteobacteria bacterium]|nr:peptidyl-prolyl cis-trans isomerase [Deltaproteobacteria bacterium]
MLVKSLVLVSLLLFCTCFSGTADSAPAAAPENPKVVMETTLGTMVIELFPDKAPISVENFLKYVDSGFYNGCIFHRIVPGFVILGGGFDKDMNKKETLEPIKNEADNGLKNLRATLSMARTPQVNSATSQFFINLKNNSALDHGSRDFGYAVFARVVEGLSVIDKIAAVKTTSHGHYHDVPAEAVIITAVKRQP